MASCPNCGAEGGLFRWPDGSTKRSVQRPRCQNILVAIWDAHRDGDELAALEAYEELSNDAEAAFVSSVLSTEQRSWLKAAMHTQRVAAGWE